MLTRKTAIKIAMEYILACREEGIRISKAYLFGSVATSRNDEDSDIDLALVSDQFTTDRLENRKMISKINIRFSVIEPHTFTLKYFKKGDPFVNEIKRTGILLTQ